MQMSLSFIGLSLVFSVIIVAAFLLGGFILPTVSKKMATMTIQKPPKADKKKSNTIPVSQFKIGGLSKEIGEVYEEKMDELQGFNGY